MVAYTLIKNGTLIDGLGGKPLEEASVLVKDNQIVKVGKDSSINAPEGVETIDAEGQYILPGLIDTHVHMTMELKNIQDAVSTPFSYRFYESTQFLKRTLNTGITSVRDAGFTDIGTKKAVDDGLIEGPRLQISINPLTITGGHGDNWTRSGVDATLQTYPGMRWDL